MEKGEWRKVNVLLRIGVLVSCHALRLCERSEAI